MSALRSAVVLASILSVTACNRGGTGKLGVSARGDGSPSAASVDVGGGISVERVRVLVQKLELERAGNETGMPMDPMDPMGGMSLVRTAEHGGDDGEDGEDEVELGPIVVDATGDVLAGTVTKVFDADVADGLYRELEIVIGPAARAAANGPVADLQGSSIVVDGTRTPAGGSATPFRFTTSIVAKQELETQILVNHAGNSANVTLVLDVTKWFTAAGGGTLDPTVEANRAAIEANMLANLRFERDDDEDGVEDGHDRDG
jgi:hypothetical protein